MTKVRSIDLLLLDDLFEMHQGYVLNFSDKTMSQFFAAELSRRDWRDFCAVSQSLPIERTVSTLARHPCIFHPRRMSRPELRRLLAVQGGKEHYTNKLLSYKLGRC
jgi:hypothetical protein